MIFIVSVGFVMIIIIFYFNFPGIIIVTGKLTHLRSIVRIVEYKCLMKRVIA